MSAPTPRGDYGRVPIGPYRDCEICKIIARWKWFFVALAVLTVGPIVLALVGG